MIIPPEEEEDIRRALERAEAEGMISRDDEDRDDDDE